MLLWMEVTQTISQVHLERRLRLLLRSIRLETQMKRLCQYLPPSHHRPWKCLKSKVFRQRSGLQWRENVDKKERKKKE